MREYDFKSIKKYIQTNSDHINNVSIGMKEDWFWTAETIYEDEHFTQEIDKDEFKVGGITGSMWATPTMQITMKDGSEVWKDCYIGKPESQKPSWFMLGPLSGPAQDDIDLATTPRITDGK